MLGERGRYTSSPTSYETMTMKLLTKDEICTQLGVSPRCLENMIQRGEFPPPTRLGKKNYWTDTALQSWFERYFHAQEVWQPVRR